MIVVTRIIPFRFISLVLNNCKPILHRGNVLATWRVRATETNNWMSPWQARGMERGKQGTLREQQELQVWAVWSIWQLFQISVWSSFLCAYRGPWWAVHTEIPDILGTWPILYNEKERDLSYRLVCNMNVCFFCHIYFNIFFSTHSIYFYCSNDHSKLFRTSCCVKRKRKRSDSVIWQKPPYQLKKKLRLHNDFGST